MTRPSSTARLQLHRDFTLYDAADIADYHASLGVSHLYLSPVFSARKGSTHGYDVTDPTTVNPELGGLPAFENLVERVRALGMGIILDIVPNHMAAVCPENAWWTEVLRHGRSGRHAKTFDIDWNRPGLEGKVLLPVLAKPYGEALAAGEIELVRQTPEELAIRCAGQRFPLSPESVNRLQAHMSKDGPIVLESSALHTLLEEQHYRLAWWRTAPDCINWRRFFEISELIGVRVEDEDVFEMTHTLIFELYRKGMIDGVRIDHIDGLANPAEYLRRLRLRLGGLTSERPDRQRIAPYVIVEKILAAGETLRPDWEVEGTTGYDFMDEVAAVLHDQDGEAPLTGLWQTISGKKATVEEYLGQARHEMLTVNFASEFAALCAIFKKIADGDPVTRDITLPMLQRVLGALLESFRVYRTYFGEGERSELDMAVLRKAADKARETCRKTDIPILDIVCAWIAGTGQAPEADTVHALQLEAVIRFQQLTSPLAAKSLEDTVFYRYGRLLSRNEVGSEPQVFSLPVEAFHHRMAQRMRNHPGSLLATATHDHKRGEDARMRLSVLSELPEAWTEFIAGAVPPVRLANETEGPDAIDRYMLFQSLVGTWPHTLRVEDASGLEAFMERIAAWQIKALRESKRRSSWTAPNERYETACARYLADLLETASEPGSMLRRVASLVRRLAPADAVNGLSQTMLRMTVPGIPDLYRGTEVWDLSLVDPDNRRPVDYAWLRSLQGDGRTLKEMLRRWQDGGIKQWLVRQVLTFRQTNHELFGCDSSGESGYSALALTGGLSANALAFSRRSRDKTAMVIVTRLAAKLLAGEEIPLVSSEKWGDTAVRPPAGCPSEWRDVLTGQSIRHERGILLQDALRHLPVALLIPE